MAAAKIVLATTNEHKAGEMRAILCPLLPQHVDIVCLSELATPIPPAEENGATFEENALKKAAHIAREARCLCIADDSGLCVNALGGAPGLYSSRWAGPDAGDPERIEKLLRELAAAQALAPADRLASFVCAAAAAAPDGWSVVTRGVCSGIITQEPRGDGGFGYDPVFFLSEYECCMAQLTPAQKNRISHRSKALAALTPQLLGHLAIV